MGFKDYVEDSGTLAATEPDDPEMNGLTRLQTMKYKRPSVNDKKKKKDKWDKIFMGEATEQKTAGIFFTNGSNVLLMKRSATCTNPFTWGLPGGHAKNKETPLETATRESREECGRIAGKRFGEQKDPGGWTCFFYKVIEPFPCKLSREHSAFKWIPFHKLKDYKLHPEFRKAAKRYIDYVDKKLRNIM